MKLNRRQALIGIGSLAVGSGAALGSGAFTSVEADRTVTVQTAADTDAYLSLTGDGEYISQSNSGTLTIDLGAPDSNAAFNEDAVTTISGVVTISSNAQDSSTPSFGFDDGSNSSTGTITIGLDTEGGSPADVTFNLNEQENTFVDSNGASTTSASTAYIDVKVDTTVDSASTTSGPLTIVADTS